MKKSQSFSAFLTAFVLLGAAVPQEIAELARPRSHTKYESICHFAEDIQKMEPVQPAEEMFETIRFQPAEGLLYQDHTVSGTSLCGITVENGELRMLSRCAATEAELEFVEEGATISLEEAAGKIGCEVRTEEDGSIAISSPFQTARLVVKSQSEIDLLNATAVTDAFRDFYVVQFPTPADAYAAYQQYNRMESVIYCIPDSILQVCDAETDAKKPLYEQNVCWGNEAIGTAEYCRELVARHDELPEITVAVLDSGINYEHEWFEGRIADGGIVFGSTPRERPYDMYGHGSQCAGIIASSTPENVKILPIALWGSSCDLSVVTLYCGMMYAIEQDVDVVSMSLGGTGYNSMLNEAAKEMLEKDILVCAAAGNDSGVVNQYPANLSGVISVSAVDSNLQLADFSNYGPNISLAAPGKDVLSVDMDGTTEMVLTGGTSMATPYVAACCANVLSEDPTLSNEAVKSYLYANALDLGEPGFDEQYGWGMVNLKNFCFASEICDKPTASIPSGTYGEKLTVTLSCKKEGAAVYYTLDGSEPTKEQGILYAGEEIAIENTTVLKAISVLETYESDVVTYEYVLISEGAEQLVEITDGVLTAYYGAGSALDLRDQTEITEIGANAFSENHLLTEIILPDTCVKIGANAFKNCSTLERLKADSVETIGEEAFYGCERLTEVSCEKIRELGEGCFRDCKALLYVGGLEQLTALPAYAFYHCTSYPLHQPNVIELGDYSTTGVLFTSDSLEWERLEKIGAYALQGLQMTDDVLKLPNVTEFGEYALSASAFREYWFSPELSVIPQGLLMNCSKTQYIYAPGVREIGNYGLAVNKAAGTSAKAERKTVVCEIDFPKLTYAGMDAFYGLVLEQAVHFDSLTNTTAEAFSNLIVPMLYLPSVIEIAPYDQSTLEKQQSTGVYFAAKVVYLENVERVADYGIRNASIVVFGEKLTSFGAAHSKSLKEKMRLHGKKESYLEQFAKENGYQFRSGSYTFEGAKTYQCFERIWLEALPLGIDYEVKWNQLDADGNVIREFDDAWVSLIATEPGELYFDLNIYDAEGRDISNGRPTIVTVTEADAGRELSLNQQVIVPKDQYNSYGFYYIPKESGKKTLWYSGAEIRMISDYGDIQRDASECGSLTYDFREGECYVILLTMKEEYAAIRLTDETRTIKPLNQCRAELETTYVVENGDQTDFKLLVESPASASGESVRLAEDDYTAIGSFKKTQSTCYVFGENEYFGFLKVAYTSCLELHPDERLNWNLEPKPLLFTPEESGRYLVSLLPSAKLLESIINGYISLTENSLMHVLHMETMEPIHVVQNGTHEVTSVEFDAVAGETYLICGEQLRKESDVLLTKGKKSLYECTWALKNVVDLKSHTDVSNPPKPVFEAVMKDGTELSEGVDYTLDVQYVISPSASKLAYHVQGMGAYVGEFIGHIIVPIPYNPYETDDYLEVGKPFTTQNGDRQYIRLDKAYELKLEILSVQTEDSLPTVKRTMELNVTNWENTIAETLTSMNSAIRLPAGEYLVQTVNSRYPDAEYTVQLTFVNELIDLSEECEIACAGVYFYTGEPIAPAVTVRTHDGTLLLEGVDYTMTYEEAIECGKYEVTLTGLKSCIGTKTFTYEIVEVPPLETIPELTGKAQLAEIKEFGGQAAYRFTADAETYAFRLDSHYVVKYTLINLTHMEAEHWSNSSMFEYDTLVRTVPGETYCLLLRHVNGGHTGEIPFTFTSDFRRLEECQAVGPTIRALNRDAVSDFELYDGEKKLVEGMDYRVKYIENLDGIGHTYSCYVGMGDYFGELKCSAWNCYETLDEYRSHGVAWDESLIPDVKKKIPEDLYSGQIKAFTVSNDTEIWQQMALWYSSFNINAFDFNDGTDEQMICSFFVYDENGNFLQKLELDDMLMVAPQTSVYLVTVIPYAEFSVDIELRSVSLSEMVTIDGVTYELNHESEAYIMEIDPSYIGIRLHDTVSSEHFTANVIGSKLSEEETARLQKGHLFYCTEGSASEQMAAEFLWLTVPLNRESKLLGDVNCNGSLDESDAEILALHSQEGKGIVSTPSIVSAGDANSDGIWSILDVLYVQNKCKENG